MIALLAALALADDTRPAATVLEHLVHVRVDAARRATEDVTWTVRIEDPAACAAGVLTPPGLDGASSGGAVVLEELLVVPQGTPAGATFTLHASRKLDRAEQSGVFLSAPDLPTDLARLEVDVPSSLPLTVWADELALPTFDTKRSRHVTFTWRDLHAGTLAQAAWSTHTDWFEAGEDLNAVVDPKLAHRDTLGREHASGIDGLNVSGITEHVFESVALDPTPGSWVSARPAREVLDSGHGTAAERGLALLSMMRVVGIDAEPGFFRPAGAYGVLPTTVPAPSLLPRPLVVVHRDDGDVYVDPAADRASVPDRPASLLGATVWVPGELPVRLPEVGVVDGAVAVNTTVTLSPDGSATFNLAVQATGAAREYLRALLAPLDEGGRTEAFAKLVRQGHPQVASLAANVTGAEKPSKPLKITLSGRDTGVLEGVPFGLRGDVAPILAPALAAWLPPRIRVVETMVVTPPTTVQILGTSAPPSEVHPEALVSRAVRRDGPKLTVITEVERPYRATTPAIEERATAFLAQQAPVGVDLLLFTAASGATAKAVRTAPALEAGDRAVLEALLWFSVDDRKKALKTLVKAEPATGFDALVTGLTHWADPDDLRPWEALLEVAGEDEGDRMRVVEGLEAAGARAEALEQARLLRSAVDPDVKVRALLAIERLQGPKPDDGSAWDDPMALLKEAEASSPRRPDPRVVYRLAELSIEQGNAADTEALLEGVERTALAEALLVNAAAIGGVPRDEVRERALAAIARDPTDPLVVSIAADALARVDDRQGALQHAVTAARLAQRDPELWALAVEKALAAGDLPTALDAAHRASDLEPESKVRAARWATLADIALDAEQAKEARVRAGMPAATDWPPTIDMRMSLDPNAMLGVLQQADHAVVAEPRLLSMRAQMRIDQDLLDDAARDGLILATTHGAVDGWALAFASTAGRQYSTVALRQLDSAAKTDLTAQVTRMEYRMITGAGDPLEDARRLGDPRASALIRSVTDPAAAAAALEGWPKDLVTPKVATPPGFRANRALSGPGYVGFSNPEAGVAVIRVGAVTGLLPPPLGLMYSVRPQAVQRIEDGGQIVRLEGGIVPLYAAIVVKDGQEVLGLGFTAAAAHQALRLGAP